MGSCVIFQGSEATLVTNYNRHELWVKGKKEENFQRPAQTIPDSPGHIREFLDSIKSRKLTTCNVEYGHRLTKGGLLGNIAYRTGERLQWDDAREKFIDNSKGQQAGHPPLPQALETDVGPARGEAWPDSPIVRCGEQLHRAMGPELESARSGTRRAPRAHSGEIKRRPSHARERQVSRRTRSPSSGAPRR